MPCNLIDSPRKGGQCDLLGIDQYTRALSEFITNSDMPTTIAIQGEWGSGKTSLMNQIRHDLCDDKDHANSSVPFHGIWINMWEYSLMKTPEEVLVNVIKGLTTECSMILERYNSSANEHVVNLKKQAWAFLKKTSVFAAKTALKAGINAIGLDGEEAVSALSEGCSSTETMVENEVRPSQFRDALQKVVDECLRIDHQNGDVIKKGFLFFIDDLDRINPEDAVHILELLKNLFEVNNCIFVLAIDYEVVVKGLKVKFASAGSGEDDRAYRSFFDKIIQLPFSMPIGSYDISRFVEDSLVQIKYMSRSELQGMLYGEVDEKLKTLDVLCRMVEYSTGPNPRSIKRLLNSLSLIQIMQKIRTEFQDGTAEMSVADKTVNFGFLCIQIAYPQIYDLLIQESNFLEWDEESAINFHLQKLSEEKVQELATIREFDELWEQVLYRACQKDAFLSIRALNISRILNIIRFIVNGESDISEFGEKINNIIDMSAVTTVSQIDTSLREKKTARGSELVVNADDLDMGDMSNEDKRRVCDKISAFGKDVDIKLIRGKKNNYISCGVTVSGSGSKTFMMIWPRKSGYQIRFMAPNMVAFDILKNDGYPDLKKLMNQFDYRPIPSTNKIINTKKIGNEEEENKALTFGKAVYDSWKSDQSLQ